MRTLYLLFLLFLVCTACTKSTETPKNAEPPTTTLAPESNCIVPNQFPKLTMMVREVKHAPPMSWASIDTTFFSYNALGQVDSIHNLYYNNTSMKVYYLPDGRVEKLSVHTPINMYTQTYTYQGNKVTVANMNHSVIYDLDHRGALTTRTSQNAHDQEVFTTDSCHQVVKDQRFYIANNQEHYLWEAAYSSTYDPLFLAQLYRIFPGYSNLHLPQWTEIVHWDCGDYASGKIPHEQKTDALGFAISNAIPALGHTYYYFYQ